MASLMVPLSTGKGGKAVENGVARQRCGRAYNLFTRGLIPLSNCYPFMTSMVPSSVSTIVTMTIG